MIFYSLQSANSGLPVELELTEQLEAAQQKGLCRKPTSVSTSCDIKNRIDFVFSSRSLSVRNAFVLYPKNSWQNLTGPSDHPGLFVELSTRN
jgi:endonuclease/exonuclease/phosphatase family metal-dependent hydrolase